MIQVTFPIGQEFIKAEASKVRVEICRLQGEERIAREILRTIQSMCEHEGQEHYTDRSGYPDSTACTKCGYTS